MTTRPTPPQDTGRPAFGFKPEGHDLVGTFDPERLDPFPGTRARYDALVAQARSPTARRQLGNVAHALLQLHKGGARILGPSAVGAVTQKCGGPSVKALSNATSAHHQALIAAFNEETGAAAGKARPKRPEGLYDEIIRALPDMHHRAAVQALVQSKKSNERQIHILKQQVGAASLPLASPLVVGDAGPLPVVAPGGRQSAEPGQDDERLALLRRAFSVDGLRRKGLAIVDGALVLERINQRILSPPEFRAIRALLGEDAGGANGTD